jgi:predicted DNA-binding transcriptional regulator AlpA
MIELIKTADLAKRLQKSIGGVYLDVRRGVLPPMIKTGERSSAFILAETDRVIQARIKGVDNDGIRELVKQIVAERNQPQEVAA